MGCSAGTAFGMKFTSALALCMEGGEEERKGKGKGKGKGKPGKTCPSVEDIMEKLEGEMAEDMCVLSNLGWLDEQGEFVEDVFGTDIATLPANVAGNITEDAISECAAEMLEMWGEDPVAEKCSESYTAEELDQLLSLGMEVASYKCFQMIFNRSCRDYVKEEIYGHFESLA